MSAENKTPLTSTEIASLGGYDLQGIKFWEDIPKLGNCNITKIIGQARATEKRCSSRIQALMEKHRRVEALNAEEVVSLSKDFENPTGSMKFDIFIDGFGDIEPVDPHSISRKGKTTTFNICGWCEHNAGGTLRHNYRTTGACELLHKKSPKVYFDTPCMLKGLTAVKTQEVLASIMAEVGEYKVAREKSRATIRTLLEMRDTFRENKPALPSFRSSAPYVIGSPIVVYVGGLDEKGVEGEWMHATIVHGYRSGDGFVNYMTDFPYISPGKCTGGGGIARPEILLPEEFEYLRNAAQKDPEFLRLWLGNITVQQFDTSTFAKHLTEGVFAEPLIEVDGIHPEMPLTLGEACQILCIPRKRPSSEEKVAEYVERSLMELSPERLENRSEAVVLWATQRRLKIEKAREFLISNLP